MKKLIAMLLAVCMVFAFAACGADNNNANGNTSPSQTEGDPTTVPSKGENNETEPTDSNEVTVMTHEQFLAAEIDAPVRVETYVQATQSWWDNKITVYCQGPDGAYFLYELACMEDMKDSLVPGTKIIVTGYKAEFNGEIEIADGTFQLASGDSYIAQPMDATALLGTDELIDHQNELVSFTGLTVKSIEYKNGEPGDDIYLTLTYGDADYSFCVERYLTDPDSEVYKTVGELVAGDVVDIEGFLYWYEGANPHITKITVTQ